jgi:selenocysteine lyase/cysteine desulfurase
VNVAALGVDFFVCSPYKFLGPHCGVLAARPDLLRTLAPDKLLPSSNTVPERFELGTLPFELLAGTNAAVDFIADLSGRPGSRRERLLASMSDVEDHEQRLFNQLESRLTELDGLTLFGHAKLRTPTLLFSIEGISSSQVSEQLAAVGVNAPAGNFYALEVARRLGLGDDGAVRAGLAPYTNQHDVDRLIDAVETIARNR